MFELVDYLILFIFLLGFTGFGWYQSRYNTSNADYFLGGKTMPWPVAMFSIVATETSVLTFISVPGIAYRGNWLFLQLAIGYIIGRLLVSYFLLPMYFKRGVLSIYEILGKAFGINIQKAASLIFLITRIFADGVRFLATAVIVQAITGWSLTAAVFLIGGVTLIYSLLGGIRTVIWIDGFQFILYISGGLISVFYLLSYIDQPLDRITGILIELDKLKVFQFQGDLISDPYIFLSAVIGGVFLSFASHGADYMMVQRVLVTKDLTSARKAMIGSGVFAFLQFALFLFIGSLLFVYFDGAYIEKDREFSTFVVNHLPIGIKGILIAGILSAAMSTISSSINALTSSTVNDWLDRTGSIKKSQLIGLFWGLVLMTIALLFDESDKALVIIGLEIASFTYGGLLGLFILSKLKIKLKTISLIVGLILSFIVVFIFKGLGLAWTWYIFLSVSVNIISTISINKALEILSPG